MIELIFENVEVGIIPTKHCKLYIIKDKVIYLEFPLSKIMYNSYVDNIRQDRVLQYNDICYIIKDNKRYEINWEDLNYGGEENKLQHSELLDSGNVRIYWEMSNIIEIS